MRTLKKTLCLVLAMTMVFGFFGVASAKGASEFPDYDDVQYKEALGVMVGIDVIDGMGDDPIINPTGKVTRAQAAKMVAYAILGADVAKDLPVTASSFDDVNSYYDWAIPSIEYLVERGILYGRSGVGGHYDPEGEVTAYEIAKMMLCAAGYGENDEYKGDSWALNVAIDARRNGIFTGTKAGNLNDPATREECALYCFNGITKVEKVNWSKDKDAYVKGENPTTIAKDVYDYVGKAGDKDKGYLFQITAVKKDLTSKASPTYGKLVATATPFGTAAPIEFVVDSYDVIGNIYNLYIGTVDEKPVVYFADKLSTEITVPTTDKDKVEFVKDHAVTTDTEVDRYTNYNTDEKVNVNDYEWATAVVYDAAKDGKAEVFAVKLSTYDTKVVENYKAPTATATGSIKLTDLNAISIPKTGDTDTKFAYTIYDTPAKGDIVSLQVIDGITNVTKATEATAKVTAIDTNKSTITAGSTYKYSLAITAGTGMVTSIDTSVINKEYTFYFGLDGKVIAMKLTDGTDAGLFYAVTEYNKTDSGTYGNDDPTHWVQGIDMAGKEVNYQVAAADTPLKQLYKVTTSVDTNGDTIATLNAIKAENVKAADAVDTDIKNTDIKMAGNCYFNSDTTFLFVSGSKKTLNVTTATGAQNVTDKYSYYATKADGDTSYTVKYVIVDGAAVETGENLMFVPTEKFTMDTAVTYTKADGSSGIAYKNIAFIDGQPKLDVLTLSNEYSTNKAITRGFYTYSKDATTGLYTLSPAVDSNGLPVCWGAGLVSSVYSNYVTLTIPAGNDIPDANATDAFIVDVPYLNNQLTHGAEELDHHTAISDLEAGDNIYFTYKTEGSRMIITGIYYMGNIGATISFDQDTNTLSVTPPAGCSYEWYKDNEKIDGAKDATYTLPDTATDTAEYSCKITVLQGDAKDLCSFVTTDAQYKAEEEPGEDGSEDQSEGNE